MKATILLAIAITIGSVLNVSGQQQEGKSRADKQPREMKRTNRSDGFVFRQELDDKQREEIRKIRTGQMKERTQTHNLLKEKRAKLEVLQTADKVDQKEINKTIDEIASIQAQRMKAEAANRQKVRSMLSEEQRILFDARSGERTRMFEERNKMRELRAERPSDRGKRDMRFHNDNSPRRQGNGRINIDRE